MERCPPHSCREECPACDPRGVVFSKRVFHSSVLHDHVSGRTIGFLTFKIPLTGGTSTGCGTAQGMTARFKNNQQSCLFAPAKAGRHMRTDGPCRVSNSGQWRCRSRKRGFVAGWDKAHWCRHHSLHSPRLPQTHFDCTIRLNTQAVAEVLASQHATTLPGPPA